MEEIALKKNGKRIRVITAMVTPFAPPDMSVDYRKARELARMLVDNGSRRTGGFGDDRRISHIDA